MEKDKATKERILESARREFLEKGYMKASLRTICKNAGVTTGALYFFFQDKEDLLRELVEEPLRGLTVRIRRHLLEEMEAGANFASTDPDSNDIQAAKEIVRFMYRYYDIFLILLSKSQGSRYENMVNYFADWGEAHYKEMAAQMAARYGRPEPDRYIIHWMAYMQISAFTHLLTHETDVEKAIENIEQIVVFLVSGWNGMFGPR
ncbi:MAG: TetR/AcrR family transcriptional regulator [Dorea sp.]|nr:TetR/AcrR family transcriptional regulator [Dorea sp.]